MASPKRASIPTRPHPGPWEEHSLVRLRHGVDEDGVHYPEGSLGTIVDVGRRTPELFEVEFADPAPAVITLRREDLTAEPWPR